MGAGIAWVGLHLRWRSLLHVFFFLSGRLKEACTFRGYCWRGGRGEGLKEEEKRGGGRCVQETCLVVSDGHGCSGGEDERAGGGLHTRIHRRFHEGAGRLSIIGERKRCGKERARENGGEGGERTTAWVDGE